ncbi:MAG: hypothetical protein ACJ8C0_05125, partial [Microvirga sp.]
KGESNRRVAGAVNQSFLLDGGRTSLPRRKRKTRKLVTIAFTDRERLADLLLPKNRLGRQT